MIGGPRRFWTNRVLHSVPEGLAGQPPHQVGGEVQQVQPEPGQALLLQLDDLVVGQVQHLYLTQLRKRPVWNREKYNIEPYEFAVSPLMAEMELCERLMILRRGEDWRMWGETE